MELFIISGFGLIRVVKICVNRRDQRETKRLLEDSPQIPQISQIIADEKIEEQTRNN